MEHSRVERDAELLRAELLSVDQLEYHAVELGSAHKVDRRAGPDRLLRRLNENERALTAAYDVVSAATLSKEPIMPVEAWLLDNFYLIEQQIVLARRHLPAGYSRHLPRLADGLGAELPRIYDVALQLISHQDGRADRDNSKAFLSAYQTAARLDLSELWAFPIMLRLALLENIRRVGSRIAMRREERDVAIAWADSMMAAAEHDPRRLIQVFADFAKADVPLTAPFVENFYARVQAQGPALAFVQSWLEHRLSEQGVSAAQLLEAASRKAAADQISIANSVGSLRFISAMDWGSFVEELSLVDQLLRLDPAGAYEDQDFPTRDRYRHAVEMVARGSAHDEQEVAQAALDLARYAANRSDRDDRTAHVGYHLVGPGRRILEREMGARVPLLRRATRAARPLRLFLYLAPIVLLTGAAVALMFVYGPGAQLGFWRSVFFGATGLLGASALVVPVVHMLITRTVPPRTLPRLDFSDGIPSEYRTMVVVPTLIGGSGDVPDLLEALEIRYLGNREKNLFFALLTDFRDAHEVSQPEDDALVELVTKGIEELNERYSDDRPSIFYLFHRPRVWNPYERLWMGYERKRGKLEQFNTFLLESRTGQRADGAAMAFSHIVGDRSLLGSIQYVITLDTDTQLPRDSARTLIGNMAHPLNRPTYDEKKGRVVDGYAILQPRTSISLMSTTSSRFTLLFAGEPGIDPYTREVSDVYQDLFGEGSFVGKGIYDVAVFAKTVQSRFPENLILSHDLLEGGYARSGLVTDVDLIEEHPVSYVMEASRRHRWARGDWQLIGWLLPRVPGPEGRWAPNPLAALTRWKLFDNLRRSLVPGALVALLLGGWLWGVGPFWMWPLMVAGVFFLPPLLTLTIEVMRKPVEREWLVHVVLTAKSTARPLARALLALIMLPYDSFIYLDAILRSAGGMLFGRRGLLMWHLPSYARRNARCTPPEFFREMWIGPLLGLAVILVLVVLPASRAIDWPYMLLIPLLWVLSPIVGWRISAPLRTFTATLTAQQQKLLHGLSRRTWRYFADFVSARDNWLPPDNYQEHPSPTVATRTSPTNIGMALLANLAAHDLGYISTGELLRRTERTLGTLAKLERFRGHFYNWYDTRTLLPLHPEYISSVDSGNLMGSLLTLRVGLEELKEQAVLPPRSFAGLKDSLLIVAEHVSLSSALSLRQHVQALQTLMESIPAEPINPAEASSMLERISIESAALLKAAATAQGKELLYWSRSLYQQCRRFRSDLRSMIGDGPEFEGMPTLIEAANVAVGGVSGVKPEGSGRTRMPRAVRRLRQIDDLILRCEDLERMDFQFLYDESRQLLSIGYDVGQRRTDPSWYDLLASEARLTSFLLVAQGQVPQKHWFALGRLLTSHGGDVSLVSWSGSMFEYLMPQLLLARFENTLLEQACRAAVSRQIEYGRQRHVPWGISESCYNAVDMHQAYQYRAFGVPGLGLKRGLVDDLVIAPYATALALTVAPRDACRNLQALCDGGFLGDYGLYEAIDFTPSRVLPGTNHATVRCFMAHHQGMSLLALEQVLLDGPMQRRFRTEPLVRTTELLLQERVPKQTITMHPYAGRVSEAEHGASAETGIAMRVLSEPDTPLPEVQLLTNGSYHVMATNAGGGYSRWRDLAVTRWREDATRDGYGTFLYLRDRHTGRYWSTAYHPTRSRPERYEAIFVQARAEYRRVDHRIEAHTEISVSAEDDAEIRQVTLTNLSNEIRDIEVTSYAEVVMAPLASDLAHRAFSNLFVETEILPQSGAILCRRRARTPEENPPWMYHLLAAHCAPPSEASYETDRARFIGRGRSTASPAALDVQDGSMRLSGTDGPVLDPIVAVRRTVTIPPDKTAKVHMVTGVAETREAAIELVKKYSDRRFMERAFEMAWFESQELLRLLNMTEADAQIYARLATSVIHGSALRRAPANVISRNRLGQSGLWRFGISGDLPIVLLRIGDVSRVELVRQVLQAHSYWRAHGLASDLLILNEDFSGYRAVLQDEIIGLVNAGPEASMLDKPGGVFVRRAEEFSEEDRVLFQTVARIVLSGTLESMHEQAQRRMMAERVPARLEPQRGRAADAVEPLRDRELLHDNGLGGFTPDGREYVISLEPGDTTPVPWCNVIASPLLGTVVSESGGAYTWAENAHEFRLTPFENDPVCDSSGEALYIRDEETGAFWSPTPLPAAGRSGYVCRHGFGYTAFEHYESHIFSEMTTYVAMDAPVKLVVVKLRNHSGRARRLSLTSYWELVMGEWRHANLMHIITERDAQTGALIARNPYSRQWPEKVVFAQTNEATCSLTGSRTEFIGRNGTLADPAGLARKRLSGKTGAGLDPCAVLQTQLEVLDGQEREVVFVIGVAADVEEARRFMERFSGAAGARQALEAVWEHWNRILGAVHLKTPDSALNVLANGWLVYQTISSRLWGRSGYYQSGGAYGFRDQLQDAMALVHTTPGLARESLLRSAERQFRDGDVQHWWHPPAGQGVRTTSSDDYLWLPHATCRYVSATGDTGVLDELVPFLEGRELGPREEAYYDLPQRSNDAATLYEHCALAIKHGLRFGRHGLPLMRGGDWNDGMNLVGHEGKGESVWLAWFLYANLRSFADLALMRGDEGFARSCTDQAEELRENIEAHAWDGHWYRRAYFDDGTPLGSRLNEECRIDSVSQSWAVISKGGNLARCHEAMSSVYSLLVERKERLVKLLEPPFDSSSLEPGYIKGYVPGVRENGGQYTHAAIWAVMALAMMGDSSRAWELFRVLNPIHHAEDVASRELYRVEPYVMSGDIYAASPHTGRGGWTWYTGAAGWMYRLAVETFVGLSLEVDKLRVTPLVPKEWNSYRVHYRYHDTLHHIVFYRGSSHGRKESDSSAAARSEGSSVLRVTFDGTELDQTGPLRGVIPLRDDRVDHTVEVEFG